MDLVTPEGVVLEFRAAGVASRALARLIDLVIQLGLLYALGIAVAAVGGAAGWDTAAAVLMSVVVLVVVIGYPMLIETLMRGRTPGKAVFSLRVVTTWGGPIQFRHAAVRSLLGFVEFFVFLGVPAFVSAMVSGRHQRLGDLAAGTFVVNERIDDRQAAAVSFWPTPGWEPYVAGLDVGGLSNQQYQTVRSFLIRWTELAPEARAHLAYRLAVAVGGRLRQEPPAGVPPELFLWNVAAAYQARTWRSR